MRLRDTYLLGVASSLTLVPEQFGKGNEIGHSFTELPLLPQFLMRRIELCGHASERLTSRRTTIPEFC